VPECGKKIFCVNPDIDTSLSCLTLTPIFFRSIVTRQIQLTPFDFQTLLLWYFGIRTDKSGKTPNMFGPILYVVGRFFSFVWADRQRFWCRQIGLSRLRLKELLPVKTHRIRSQPESFFWVMSALAWFQGWPMDPPSSANNIHLNNQSEFCCQA